MKSADLKIPLCCQATSSGLSMNYLTTEGVSPGKKWGDSFIILKNLKNTIIISRMLNMNNKIFRGEVNYG